MREAEEVKGLGFVCTAFAAIVRCKPPEFDQPGHRRMQFEAISLKSGAKRSQKRTAV